jgi:GNAT superfamily N-acetyltransferase
LVSDPDTREQRGALEDRRANMPSVDLVRLQTTEEVEKAEPLFREYVEWARERLATDYGIVWGDAEVERAHEGFRIGWPKLLGERGRIYLARHNGQAAGVGALKPISDEVAEVKRVFVRPEGRGLGIARTIMTRLIDDATALSFRMVRLDTMPFMTDAHRLYRSLGFVDAAPYAGEGAEMGLGIHSIYMELNLEQRG